MRKPSLHRPRSRSTLAPQKSQSVRSTNEVRSLKAGIAQDFARFPPKEIFDRLLTTWPLRYERSLGKDKEARRGLSPLQLEDLDGDGHYQDRRRLLHVCLKFLEREQHVWLPAVFEALVRARSEAVSGSLRRAKLLTDRTRRFDPEQQLRTRLIQALKAYHAHRMTWDPGGPTLALVNQLLSELDSPNPPRRKLPRGRSPLLQTPAALREALAKAGVPYGRRGFDQALTRADCEAAPRNLREALLMAVGLIPYRMPQA